MNLTSLVDTLSSSLIDQGTSAVSNTVAPERSNRKGLLADILGDFDDDPQPVPRYRESENPRDLMRRAYGGGREERDEPEGDDLASKVKGFFITQEGADREKKRERDTKMQRDAAKKRAEDIRNKYGVRGGHKEGLEDNARTRGAATSATAKKEAAPAATAFSFSSIGSYLGLGGATEQPVKEKPAATTIVDVKPKKSLASLFAEDYDRISEGDELLTNGVILFEQGTDKGRLIFWLGELDDKEVYHTENENTLVRLSKKEVQLVMGKFEDWPPRHLKKDDASIKKEIITIPPQPSALKMNAKGVWEKKTERVRVHAKAGSAIVGEHKEGGAGGNKKDNKDKKEKDKKGKKGLGGLKVWGKHKKDEDLTDSEASEDEEEDKKSKKNNNSKKAPPEHKKGGKKGHPSDSEASDEESISPRERKKTAKELKKEKKEKEKEEKNNKKKQQQENKKKGGGGKKHLTDSEASEEEEEEQQQHAHMKKKATGKNILDDEKDSSRRPATTTTTTTTGFKKAGGGGGGRGGGGGGGEVEVKRLSRELLDLNDLDDDDDDDDDDEEVSGGGRRRRRRVTKRAN